MIEFAKEFSAAKEPHPSRKDKPLAGDFNQFERELGERLREVGRQVLREEMAKGDAGCGGKSIYARSWCGIRDRKPGCIVCHRACSKRERNDVCAPQSDV